MKRYIVATNKNAWSVKQENSLFTVFFFLLVELKNECVMITRLLLDWLPWVTTTSGCIAKYR